MQSINEAYHAKLAHQHQHDFTDSSGETRTYYYNEKRENAVIDKLSEFFASNVPGEALIVGSWIWVLKSDEVYKKPMKELGFNWNDKRECYQWHEPRKNRKGGYRRTKLSDKSTDELLGYYGARKVGRPGNYPVKH